MAERLDKSKWTISSMNSNYSISLIIPVGPDETKLCNLLGDLKAQRTLAGLQEILVVSVQSQPPSQQEQDLVEELRKLLPVRVEVSLPGRALQINCGVELAKGNYCWILHADTRLGPDTISALNKDLQLFPEALLFFGLTFYGSDSNLMKLTEFGTWFRSHILHIPFGDQGFCMRREHIISQGGFDQAASYGEDHLFLWNWRLSGRKVIPVSTTIATSARKYQKKGWIKVTLQHCYLTWKQALPFISRLFRMRLARIRSPLCAPLCASVIYLFFN